MRKFIVLTFMLSLLLVPQPILSAEGISYDGSTVIVDSVLNAGAQKAFEEKTGVKFITVGAAGTGAGLTALLEGKVNLAGSGRPLKEEEKSKGLVGTVIGFDAIGIWVNKDNPVKGLTKEQLKGIYSGKIVNWKDVGGQDVAMTAYTEPLDSKKATLELVQEKLLDKQPYGSVVKQLDSQTEMLALVAKEAGAITAVSVGVGHSVAVAIRDKIKFIAVDGVATSEDNIRGGLYLLTRPILLATKGAPEGDVKKFIDFMLSTDGQAIIGKNFVKVKR